MKPERWQQIDHLYHAALDYDSAKRAAFLGEACADDPELRREVESLIKSHERAGSFITEPAMKVAARMMAEDQPTSRVGQTVSHYKVEALLGLGGMGEVYLAEDISLGRKVALKFLPVYLTADPERLRRFKQEARTASALNHPNIVTVHEIGNVDTDHFIAAEFIDGVTLRERRDDRPFELSEALDIAAQIASALSAAHEAGIVHRDIKPENVMLRRDGFVKVLDFGLAKLAAAAGPSHKLKFSTDPGMVMGTAHYMSPEQARGEDVDTRTDIWSLGVVLYEMVIGQMPFTGETPSHVIVSILESQPLLGDGCEVPPELEEVIGKALRKNREERYETANELALDLKNLKQELELQARTRRSLGPRTGISHAAAEKDTEALHGSGMQTSVTTPRPTSNAEYLVRKIKSHKRGAALAAAAMILVLTASAYFFYSNRTSGHVTASGEAIDSLLVMPFVNESGDSNSDYLADGITESVIRRLTQLPELRVISHEAVLRYRSKQVDPQALGREFKVRAVLIGRMKQRGDGLAVSTELVDVRDNTRLWGEQYDRKLSDVLIVQEEVALKISEGLRLRITGEEKKKLEKRYTQNPEAFKFYSSGNYQLRNNTREGIEKSIEYYERAIRIDPRYALAYVGLAEAHHRLQFRGFKMAKENLQKREWAALKAVEVDEMLSEAHVALARVKQFSQDYVGAEKEIKRALELDPNSFDANQRYALDLAYAGRTDEALVYAHRCYELSSDPTRSSELSFIGFVYLLGGQYDDAIQWYLKAIERSPANITPRLNLGEAYLAKGMYKESIAELKRVVASDSTPEAWDRYPVLAFAYAVSGNRDEALKILAEQKRLAKQRYINPYNFAIIYTGLGDKDRAFEYLNKAFEEGKPLLHVPVRPLFESLRSDPRYKELLHRIGRAP